MLDYKEVQTKLTTFYNSLGVPAYRGKAEQGDPLPYIVYDVNVSEFAEQQINTIRVYSDSSSYLELTNVVNALSDKLPLNIGGIYIDRGTPFVQDDPNSDDNVKGVLINLLIMQNY